METINLTQQIELVERLDKYNISYSWFFAQLNVNDVNEIASCDFGQAFLLIDKNL